MPLVALRTLPEYPLLDPLCVAVVPRAGQLRPRLLRLLRTPRLLRLLRPPKLLWSLRILLLL